MIRLGNVDACFSLRKLRRDLSVSDFLYAICGTICRCLILATRFAARFADAGFSLRDSRHDLSIPTFLHAICGTKKRFYNL
jgi:hypothetical protein